MILQTIFDKALAKIEANDFSVQVFDPLQCLDGTDKFSPEEEVQNWMLAKTMRDKKDRRYRNVCSYIKAPNGIKFDTTQFSMKEIVFFVSPQTELTSN